MSSIATRRESRTRPAEYMPSFTTPRVTTMRLMEHCLWVATPPVTPTQRSYSKRGSVLTGAATRLSVFNPFLTQAVAATRLSALGRSLALIPATITPPSMLEHSEMPTLATTTSHWVMVLVLIFSPAITTYISTILGLMESPTQSASAPWGRIRLRLSPGLAEQQ